jgi:hypothetical protein
LILIKTFFFFGLSFLNKRKFQRERKKASQPASQKTIKERLHSSRFPQERKGPNAPLPNSLFIKCKKANHLAVSAGCLLLLT